MRLTEYPKNRNGGSNRSMPLVSIVVPAYNEAAIIENSLETLCRYMDSLENQYEWELIVIDDGSTDETGMLAEAFAKTRTNVLVLHHIVNSRLGQALRTAFKYCKGDYVVTLDIDLSYSPEHIERMLEKITRTKAEIVLASPYMKGGHVSNVPWVRRKLSVLANRFLSWTARGDSVSTLTGMVRAYEGEFLRSLNLKAMDTEINAEIIYKAMLLRARILEVPAHLDWGQQKSGPAPRTSSIKVMKSLIGYLLSGFFFRPFMFFLVPGFLSIIGSLYSFMWVLIHTVNNYRFRPAATTSSIIRLSGAVADAYQQAPHTFIIGGFMLTIGIQLFSLGFLSFQNKRYFEELFNLNTTIYSQVRKDVG